MTIRLISPEELADLSLDWENATVDTRFYYQAVMHAWEVDRDTYITYKAAGGLCQKWQGCYYIA